MHKTTPSSALQRGKPVVIIGGGVAGTTCASHLSELVAGVPIVLIDANGSLKLSSKAVSVTHLAAEVEIQAIDAREWCKQKNITYLQAHVTALRDGVLMLSNGKQQAFSMCCIATGAYPFVPKALRNQKFEDVILTLRDSESVERLYDVVSKAGTVLVVGGGGIAMEVVEELCDCKVVWVNRSDVGGCFFDARASRSLYGLFKQSEKVVKAANVDGEVSFVGEKKGSKHEKQVSKLSGAAVGPQWFGGKHRNRAVIYDKNGSLVQRTGRVEGKEGMKRVLHCEVLKVEKDKSGDCAMSVSLSNDEIIGCDSIIVGCGVVANVGWLQDSGVDLKEVEDEKGGGIIVKGGIMESNVEGIFAGGDCAYVQEEDGSDWFQMRLWRQAEMGGRAIAQNMARRLGVGDGYNGIEFEIFAHTTVLFEKRVVLLGRFDGEGVGDGFQEYERVEEGGGEYVRVIVQNGRVRGAVLVGDVEYAEVYENLMMTQLDVGWLGADLVTKESGLEEYFD